MRARGGFEADALQALVDGVDGGVLLLIDGLHVLLAANVGVEELFPVQGGYQAVVELHVVDPQRHGHVADVELVLAVGREEVSDGHAAARSERQPFFIELLVAGVLDGVLRAVRTGRYLAHGVDGDGARRRQVLIEERWRNL